METTNGTINKAVVFEAVKALIDTKARKAKSLMRIEYGDAFAKMPLKDYLKVVDRQAIESDEIMKEQLTNIYRTQGKEKFKELVEEAKEYTDDEFLEDIKEVFGIDNANFLRTEIKRLKYANDR